MARKSAQDIEILIGQIIDKFSLGKMKGEEINSAHHLMNDVGLDSLDYATVVLNCEKEMGIALREETANWAELQTVAQLAAFFERHQP